MELQIDSAKGRFELPQKIFTKRSNYFVRVKTHRMVEKGRSDCSNEPKGCKPIRDAEKEKSPGFCQISIDYKERANQFCSRGIPNPALEINSKNSQKQIHWNRF